MNDLMQLYLDNNTTSDEPLAVNSCGICTEETDSTARVERPEGREDYLLLTVISGELTYRTPAGEEQHLSAGQVVLFRPHQPQYYHSEPGAAYETRWVHFSGTDCPRLLEQLGLTVGLALPVGDTVELQRLTADMVGEFIQRKPFYQLALQGRFMALLALIARQRQTAATGKGAWEPRLEEARKEIYWTHRYEIDLERLAGKCQLSPSRFQHLFKKQYGVSPRHYQTMLRVNSARSLLQSTDLSIRQVGEKVGYADQNYFSRVFKRYTGYSPSDLRK